MANSNGVLAALEAFIDLRLQENRFLVIGQSYGGYLGRPDIVSTAMHDWMDRVEFELDERAG